MDFLSYLWVQVMFDHVTCWNINISKFKLSSWTTNYLYGNHNDQDNEWPGSRIFYYSDLSFFHLEIQFRLLMHVTAGDGEATSDIIHFPVVLRCIWELQIIYSICISYQDYLFVFFALEIWFKLLMHFTIWDGETTLDFSLFPIVFNILRCFWKLWIIAFICMSYQGYPFGFLFNNSIQTFDVCYSRAWEIERLSSLQFLNSSCQIRPQDFAMQWHALVYIAWHATWLACLVWHAT